MKQKDLYESLAAHLDQNVVGAPLTESFLKILEISFPGEEAQIALKLPFSNQTLAQLAALYPDRTDGLEEILKRMVKRGTVYTSQPPGRERVFRLLPTVVGFAETPFWSGKDTPEARALAPLWFQYRDEGFSAELARGTPVMRVIPVETAVKDASQILRHPERESRRDDLQRRRLLSLSAGGALPGQRLRPLRRELPSFRLDGALHRGAGHGP
jgi:hypothetical protein